MSAQSGKASARSVLDKFQALESQVYRLQPALLAYKPCKEAAYDRLSLKLQWRQYETKIATRSAEQTESLKNSAVVLQNTNRTTCPAKVNVPDTHTLSIAMHGLSCCLLPLLIRDGHSV